MAGGEISVIDLWNPDLLRVSLGLKKTKLEGITFTGNSPVRTKVIYCTYNVLIAINSSAF